MPRMTRRDLAVGTTAMILTTGLWATVYFAPLLLPGVPATAVAGGRYLAFGLASLVLAWRLGVRFDRVPWGKAFTYAVTGFVGYFLLLTLSVKVAGPTLTVVVMGAGPVLYSALGSRDAAERRRLVGPGAVIVTGVVLAEAAGATGLHGIGWGRALGGLALTLVAMLSWIWYGLDNARLLAERRDLKPQVWTSVVGVATGVVSLPLVAFALAGAGGGSSVTESRTVLLLAALGLGPALIGSLGWNVASSRLSPATAGQLIVLEPLFALTYAAVWTGHAPTGAALVGQVLLLTGAAWGVWVTASRRGGAAAGVGRTGPRRWRRVGPRLSAAGS